MHQMINIQYHPEQDIRKPHLYNSYAPTIKIAEKSPNTHIVAVNPLQNDKSVFKTIPNEAAFWKSKY